MTKRNTFILILIAMMFSITINVVINDIGYTLAYVIYCFSLSLSFSFSFFLLAMCVFITKRKTDKYMEQLKEETQSIIYDINTNFNR